jgi:predicted dehydrogenase
LSLYCARRQKPPTLTQNSDVLQQLGPEVVDLLSWLAQSPVLQVYAEVGRLFDSDRIGADTALVMLTYADGSTGLVELAWSLPPHYPREEDLEVEVAGPAGTIFVQPLNQKVEVYASTSPNIVWEDWAPSPTLGLIDEIVETVRGQRPWLASYDNARLAHRVVSAAQQSAQLCRPIKPVESRH